MPVERRGSCKTCQERTGAKSEAKCALYERVHGKELFVRGAVRKNQISPHCPMDSWEGYQLTPGGSENEP